MLRYVRVVLLFTIITSCNQEQQDSSLPLSEPVLLPQKTDSTAMIEDSHFFWTVDQDQEAGVTIKKSFPISKDSLSIENMISMINEQYPGIQIDYERVSHDTIFLKINKSEYLTQRIGSTGAEAYLAVMTFNMTELKGINVVDIRFKMGDHAEPGVYTRIDFIHEVKIKL